MLRLESNFGVHRASTFKKFEKRINQARNDLVTLLSKLQREGKSVAGYGASATSTTLIYHFKLQKILNFILDDYKRKQNTFSPGCHIPVFASPAALVRKPDYVVILAWRYAERIFYKNREYLRQGGKFIIPLPKLKIVSN